MYNAMLTINFFEYNNINVNMTNHLVISHKFQPVILWPQKPHCIKSALYTNEIFIARNDVRHCYLMLDTCQVISKITSDTLPHSTPC